jgi:hypothetical protein
MTAQPGSASRRVLRRIHKNHYKRSQPIEILPVAFRPSRRDTDGLSVYLTHDFGGPTPLELAGAGGRAPADFLVVELREDDLVALGLSVKPDESPDAPQGHAVIPEINYADYSEGGDRRRKLKDLTVRLAQLASHCIVDPMTSDGPK